MASLTAGDMRIAFGDLPGIESIQTLAAIERAKERGVNIELIILNDEDLAAQAIVGGQADVGIGSPYTLIQKVGVPIRLFAQISTQRFFPVVNAEEYKSWKDLDGQEVVVQARGSGTEAVMMLMAKQNGISFSKVSYVPGSEVRRNAMLQGTIKASIVDAANRRALEQEAPGKFIVLPVEGVSATDEGLFATEAYLKNNAADVDILVEELMKTAREITENPQAAVDMRNKYNLLSDLGGDADGEIDALLDDVDNHLVEGEVHLHFRVLPQEAVDDGHQIGHAKGHRRVDAQGALHLLLDGADAMAQVVDLLEYRHAAGVELRAGLRQVDAPRRAVEQPRTQPLLQHLHVLGRSRRRNAKMPCSFCKAAVSRDAGKYCHHHQLVHEILAL